MNYFVTGATGFVGRHLVQELLKRDGTIYVLVREGSRGKIDELIESLGAGDRIVPVAGDMSEQGLGVEDFDEKIDHFFHLAAIYDVAADPETMIKANVEGTRHVVEFVNSHDVGRFHHTSSIAVAGELQGRVPGGHVRRGPEAPPRLPRVQVRLGEAGPPRGPAPDADLPPRHRRRALRDRRDGQDRRPLLLLRADQAPAPRPAGVVPAGRARGRPDQHRPGGLRGPGDGPHRPPPRRRPARRHLPPGQPRGPDRGRDAQRVRQGRPRAAVRHAGGPQRDQRDPQAGAGGREGAAHGQAHPRDHPARPGDPAGRDGEPRLPLHLRPPRHPAGAPGHGHRGAAAVHLRAARCGTTGSATSTRRCSASAR